MGRRGPAAPPVQATTAFPSSGEKCRREFVPAWRVGAVAQHQRLLGGAEDGVPRQPHDPLGDRRGRQQLRVHRDGVSLRCGALDLFGCSDARREEVEEGQHASMRVLHARVDFFGIL